MSGRANLFLSLVLFVAALFAGYWGLALSRVPAPEDRLPASTETTMPSFEQVRERVEQEQRKPVVVFVRGIRPHVALVAEDLAIEQLRIVPVGSFSTVEELVGRSVWFDIPAGTLAHGSHFEQGGPLSRMIRPNERALAIAVDEVIGVGGHVTPGDYVDLLLYAKKTDDNPEQTAQVVVPGLRVLSYGKALGTSLDGKPVQPVVDEAEKGKEAATARRDAPRTVVLAVPEVLVTRFMLASGAGTLRLAVRSADEQLLAKHYAGAPTARDVDEMARQLIRFEKLAARPVARPAPSKSAAAPARSNAIEVHRGAEVSRQNF
ncbi:Flp pilus assembly protein CpaB [Pseudomonas sp. ABC1]|uniref:Flp pilus assembly protein CpaB n=1 Tax=Pseudomonas sp. ABC1 TaxID=2748080 RepID=UPI0015C3E1AF|nr:Flp pilus assembly protein CpaB [Pseudomonas sp. ABC1]QLF93146.1 Flp pilus assembly protein CpaB [Pseudomonas sp. ABC1]